MNDSELIKQKDGWQTDAEGTDPSVIKNIIYENGLVAEFLNKKNKYFIIASKGVGKTLLLKYKRFILEAQYSNITNDQKVIFIPQNTPYLDFITDLGSLSKNHRDRLSDYKFARRVWTMSLIISSMSYYNHISVADLSYFSQEIGEMCDKFNHRYAKYINWCEGQTIVRPNVVFSRILQMSVSHINIFLDEYYLFIEDLFRGIHSGIFIFIDRLDQALQENDEHVKWTPCQDRFLVFFSYMFQKNRPVESKKYIAKMLLVSRFFLINLRYYRNDNTNLTTLVDKLFI